MGISAGRRGRSEGTDDQLILKIERAGTRVIHPCSAASGGGTGMARTEVHRRRAPLPLLLTHRQYSGDKRHGGRDGGAAVALDVSAVLSSQSRSGRGTKGEGT